MNKSRLYIGLLLSSGAVVTLTGLTFIAMYIREAIIMRIGDPDQSLLFWYLPILFIGVLITTGGITLLIVGIARRRTRR